MNFLIISGNLCHFPNSLGNFYHNETVRKTFALAANVGNLPYEAIELDWDLIKIDNWNGNFVILRANGHIVWKSQPYFFWDGVESDCAGSAPDHIVHLIA